MYPILSRNQIKFIRSLKQKKIRYKFKNYMVEGVKQVNDILNHDPEMIDYVVAVDDQIPSLQDDLIHIYTTDTTTFNEISNLVQPQGIMAICKIPDHFFIHQWDGKGFTLYFDGIQDPGNFGTILRTAEWFGINQVLVGPGTVDPYSPKVVQASMGSQAYLQLYQYDHARITQMSCPILVADMHGQNAYRFQWPEDGVLVLGNEGQGISPFFQKIDVIRLTLPSHPDSRTESLNVGMACTSLLTLRQLQIYDNRQD